MNESLKRLEEKIAFLERHVTEQDKAMLAFGDDLVRLRRELKALREQMRARGDEGPDAGGSLDERPPHY